MNDLHSSKTFVVSLAVYVYFTLEHYSLEHYAHTHTHSGARVCVCVRACAGVCMCVSAQVCACAFGCFAGANGCIPLTMLVDVCQCCCLFMFVRLPLSRHDPCCKTW